MKINYKFWNKKKVLITGHTGFKGGWLTVLLSLLNAKVSGYALNPRGKFNFFNEVKLKNNLIYDFRKDIRSIKDLKQAITITKPEIIFHLAAQSSVIESFKDSRNTISTNIIGTSNILEAIKNNKNIKSLIIVTTDKVYQNYNIKKYFDENSLLGGDDIYSGSKTCCEILAKSYQKSFFSNNNCKIATVRAGNCFGGGDWTEDRIVKDCLELFFQNKNLKIRNPNANRPWQHVIEPLIGYLLLAQKLFFKQNNNYVGAWNFGPSTKQNMKVINLAKIFKTIIKSKSKIIIKKNDSRFQNKKFKVFESIYLNINSQKAFKKLGWKPKLSISKAAFLTIEWYNAFLKKKNLFHITKKQIQDYLSIN